MSNKSAIAVLEAHLARVQASIESDQRTRENTRDHLSELDQRITDDEAQLADLEATLSRLRIEDERA